MPRAWSTWHDAIPDEPAPITQTRDAHSLEPTTLGFLSGTSVQRGIIGHPRDQCELPALAREHVLPELGRLDREQLRGQRRLDDPRFFGELPLELACAPAGVTCVNPAPPHRLLEPVALGRRRDESDVVDH